MPTTYYMLKYIFIFLIFMLTASAGKCVSTDTALIFYKNYRNGYKKVYTRDSCDFLRLIYPNAEKGNGYSVHEYYKNGKLKFVGQTTDRLAMLNGTLALDGDCIIFFENGKRQAISHYNDGYKEGTENLFYPNGKAYAVKKYRLDYGAVQTIINWECYDTTGDQICKDGNGQWLMYDDNFKNIILQGPVKNGQRNGEWHGRTMRPDSSYYFTKYKNGIKLSSTCYDQHAKAYPFENDDELAYYWSGPINFLRTLQTHLKLPKDSNGKKISADDVIISFVVERDGHLDEFETHTVIDQNLKIAITEAFLKCKNWIPHKNFGIPVRAKIIFPMKYLSTYERNAFVDEIQFAEVQLEN
jgi:antitoxin component YwqK of YwqJK toxin-antitoxin module